jgi:toxin ParE2
MMVRLLEPAQAELDEAITWYADQAPGLGDAFLIETIKVITLIRQFPLAWHPLTPEIRRCRLRRFPYCVVYTQDGDELLVLAIAHQHRKPNYWRSRLM